MSGHSKWHKIQHKKGKTDKARSALFTKLTRAVTLAASQGGGDPAMNFSLRLAIEKAKQGNVPKDNIERAIKRGTGELVEGGKLEEVVYEGFGPGGVAFLIEAVTDNNNRTASEVKHIFSRYGGSLGAPGSVSWQFKRVGVARLAVNDFKLARNDNDIELAIIEGGADDIREDGEIVEIICSIEKLDSVLAVVRSFGIKPEDSGLEWVVKEGARIDSPGHLDKETSGRVESLYEAFSELDDVKGVYVNLR